MLSLTPCLRRISQCLSVKRREGCLYLLFVLAVGRPTNGDGADVPFAGGGAGVLTFCDGCYNGTIGVGQVVSGRVADGDGCILGDGFYLSAWQFNQSVSSRVSFMLNGLQRNPRLVLADSACNTIAQNDGCEARSNFPPGQIWGDVFTACISRDLPPGTYYLLVTTSQPQPLLEYTLEAVTPSDYYPPCAYDVLNTVILSTEAYHCAVDSASGAVGDVVPVTVSLHSRLVDAGGFFSFHILLCHDPNIVEIVGNPVYTHEFLVVASPLLNYQAIEEGSGQPGDPRGHGFDFGTSLPGYSTRFPSLDLLPVMTMYYRIKGTPGQTGQLSFCNTLELGNGRCRTNSLHTSLPVGIDEEKPHLHTYFSHAHQGGTITVLPGPATRPDRPPEPPEARIYDPLPTKEQVNFRIRVSSGIARPGDVQVPVEIYVRADVEYAGIVLPIDFDERYLRLARAEHHFVTGVAQINNRDAEPGASDTEGWCVVTNGFGINNYRLAAEGEEIHAATLYFDVLAGATEINETTLTASTVWRDGRAVRFFPWVAVRYSGGIGAGAGLAGGKGAQQDVAQSKVEPTSISNGKLLIPHGPQLFRRGDSNQDGGVDLSDAIFTLGFLFLGTTDAPCLDAADANDDGELDISDAVLTLSVLFSGVGTIQPPNSPGLDPTADGLDCLYYFSDP